MDEFPFSAALIETNFVCLISDERKGEISGVETGYVHDKPYTFYASESESSLMGSNIDASDSLRIKVFCSRN